MVEKRLLVYGGRGEVSWFSLFNNWFACMMRSFMSLYHSRNPNWIGKYLQTPLGHFLRNQKQDAFIGLKKTLGCYLAISMREEHFISWLFLYSVSQFSVCFCFVIFHVKEACLYFSNNDQYVQLGAPHHFHYYLHIILGEVWHFSLGLTLLAILEFGFGLTQPFLNWLLRWRLLPSLINNWTHCQAFYLFHCGT